MTTGRTAWLMYCAFALALVGLTGGLMFQSRLDALKAAEITAEKFREMASIGLLQGIQGLDLSLRGLVDGLSVVENEAITGSAEKAFLFDRSATSGTFGWLLVLDKNGTVVKSLDGRPQSYENRSKWPSFQAHLLHDDLGLLIQRPFVPNDTALTLSRRVTRAGAFAGVVIGTVKMAFVLKLLEQATPPGGSAVLMKTDGALLLRTPLNSLSNLKGPEVAARHHVMKSGTYYTSLSTDGTDRIVSYGPVGDYPLLVRVAMRTDAVLAAWARQSAATGAIVLLLLALLGGFVHFLLKQLDARAQAEQKAIELASELATLATTDKLTGLPNRRLFDQQLEKKWAEAARTGNPVALLMIDVDFFKRFNDTQGHPAGDAALSKIARVIASSLKRPSDMAARYGGEEFAVLLPETEAEGAASVAEAILAAVMDANVFFPAGIASRATVSVGLACLVAHGLDAGALVADADRALYAAKRAGRNCLVIADDATTQSEPMLRTA